MDPLRNLRGFRFLPPPNTHNPPPTTLPPSTPYFPTMLPLFPLTTVLFPGAPMPLHIFEPRYRQMLADCLEGDRRFGLVPGELAEPGAVGCIAHIRVAQPLADGRSNIVVVGEKRFRVLAIEAAEHPYLMGRTEDYEDRPESAPTPQDQSALIERAGRYRELLRVLMDGGSESAEWSSEPVPLSFQVAALLEAPLEIRLRLLSTRSTTARVKALIEVLPPLLREASTRVEVHLRAPSNGVGGPHHEIVAEG